MAEVSLDLLQGLVQKVLDGQAKIDADIRGLRGRMVLMERRLLRRGSEIAAHLQGQLDEHEERLQRLETPPD